MRESATSDAIGDALNAGFCVRDVLYSELGRLFFAALFFCGGAGDLRVELIDALLLRIEETVGALEVGVGVAAALFEARERGGSDCCAGRWRFRRAGSGFR